MLEKLSALLEKMTTSDIPKDALAEIQESLNTLKTLVVCMLLNEQKEVIEETVEDKGADKCENECNGADGETSSDHDISHPEALNNLEDIATSRKDEDGKRDFLLHRGLKDYEYEKGKEGDQFTAEESEWVPEVMSGEADQKNDNPVITCWIPEDSIKEIPNPYPNNSTWGELGSNPHRYKYKVIIKPGKYEIYQELKA